MQHLNHTNKSVQTDRRPDDGNDPRISRSVRPGIKRVIDFEEFDSGTCLEVADHFSATADQTADVELRDDVTAREGLAVGMEVVLEEKERGGI